MNNVKTEVFKESGIIKFTHENWDSAKYLLLREVYAITERKPYLRPSEEELEKMTSNERFWAASRLYDPACDVICDVHTKERKTELSLFLTREAADTLVAEWRAVNTPEQVGTVRKAIEPKISHSYSELWANMVNGDKASARFVAYDVEEEGDVVRFAFVRGGRKAEVHKDEIALQKPWNKEGGE
ncbi:hypothetical protein KYLE_105 [Pantoea phage Kyle]|uniref:Uncharacterized protein n=1 Tax=Pantoea phage Kyle TaxID=2589665 RepID=A0A514A8J2_9CAUD|nr:hypothetical protein HWC52_gp105 [Pantoea phage Kyle]QDH49593.1 hypothetical protein KYLE_105 [Pantoea phage Kyle]